MFGYIVFTHTQPALKNSLHTILGLMYVRTYKPYR